MSIRPQCSKIALSYYKEREYGAAVLDANINKRFNPTAPPIFDLVQTRIDDAADIKGYEWPKDAALDIITAQDISLPLSFPCSTQLAGLLFALAMGNISTSGTGSPAYTHVIKPQDACTNDVLPSTSIIMGLTGDTSAAYQLRGCVANDLKLVLDSAGRLIISPTFQSNGALTPKPDYTFPSAEEAQDWFLGTHGDFKTCNYGGALASLKTKLRGMDFTIANNLDVADGRSNVVNAGKYLTTLRFGQRTYTLVVRFDGHPSTEETLWNDYMNETIKDVQLLLTHSTAFSLGIRMKKVKIISVKSSFDGLRDVLEVTYKAFYEAADSAPVVVTIANNVSGYLSYTAPSASPSESRSPSASPSPSASASPSASVSPSSSRSPSASASA